MVKFEHCVFCRKCKVYMGLGAFNFEKGRFDGPYIQGTTQRTESDWALRRFLEIHRRHDIGFASDEEIEDVSAAGFKEVEPVDAFCVAFATKPKAPVYDFEKFSKRFGRALFIIDVYGWAWDIASRELLEFLPRVEGKVVDARDFGKMEFRPEDWDMVLVYPWSHREIMDRLDPRNTVVCVAGGEQLRIGREFNYNCGRFMVYGANNKKIQKALKKKFPRKRVILLSHGVDTEKFAPDPIGHDGFVVLWAGAVSRASKRFRLAEKIVSEAGGKLKVAGRGQEGIYVPHDEMPGFYNSGDVLLITSEYEAHPLVAYEAMSCGIPIISTDVGDLDETVRNGRNGFIFRVDDDGKALLEALRLLKEDGKFRKEMGAEARRTILQKWKWEDIANQYRALGKTPPPERDAPRVSVVVAVKNRVGTIRRCMDSVLAEGYPNLELIVVDGASGDGTLEILRGYERKYDSVRVISEPDRSQGEARNKGLEIATGDFVTFLDADDEQVNGKLGALSGFLANSDRHFAVFGNTAFRNLGKKVIANNRKSVPSEISFKTVSRSNYIGLGAIMLRNSPEVRFDEGKRFGEDHSLWMKLVAKYPFAYLDFDAFYWTQGSPEGLGKNTPRWREIVEDIKEEAALAYHSSPHSEKMRIAVFCDVYGLHPFGGPAVYGYNIAEMLYRSRMYYTMYYNPLLDGYPHPDYYRRKEFMRPRPDEIDIDNFNVFYVMDSPKAILALNRRDVLPIIGSNHITNSAPEHCLKYLTGKELVSREHRIQHEKAFMKTYKGKFWFAQSKFQIGEYERVGMDLNEIKVYLAPNPIDTDLFKRRGEFGESIVWSGKNNWAKGVPFLKKVARGLPNEFTCLWGGEGDDLPQMPRNCAVATGNTMFHMPKFLEGGQMFLSTSVTENQPCAVLEAMAMELPVVGFRTSGMPEVVEDGETGFLVELGNTDAMIEKIKLLLGDESLRREMGRKARKFVVDNFSYYRVLDVYLDHFKRYLEG